MGTDEQRRITRRRFLTLAGGAVGATALACGSLALVGTRQMAVGFVESSCGDENASSVYRLMMKAMKSPEGDYRDWDLIRGWAADLPLALVST